MAYFSYHAVAKRLLAQGKLTGFFYTQRYRNIGPALVLLFDDAQHPVMPIRPAHWQDYTPLLPREKQVFPPE